MLSTDRTIVSPLSPAAARMRDYGAAVGALTVIVAGPGKPHEVYLSPQVHIIYPGGRNKPFNALKMLVRARSVSADVVSAQDPFWVGLIGILVGKPIQIQVHTDTWGMIGSILAWLTLPRATRIRVVSERVRARVSRVTTRPIDMLPIFVDPEHFFKSAAQPREFGLHPRILVVARLSPEKRIDRVIRVLTRISDAHVYIVGTGALKAELVSLASSLGVGERTHFLGWRDDVRPYYQYAHVFVNASRYEGYGMALLEAALSGCPIVTTDVGIARELPKELCAITSDDTVAITSTVRAQLQLDQATRAQGARAARVLVGNHDAYVRAYEHALRRVLEG